MQRARKTCSQACVDAVREKSNSSWMREVRIRALLRLAEAHSSISRSRGCRRCDRDVVVVSSEALTLKDNNGYYNLRQYMNYFVLVPGVISKTLVDRWCSTQSNLRCI